MKIRQANKIIKRIFSVTVLGSASPMSPNWFRVNFQKKECNCYSKNQKHTAIRVICRYSSSFDDVKKLIDLDSNNKRKREG
jgi:hypothetical protein